MLTPTLAACIVLYMSNQATLNAKLAATHGWVEIEDGKLAKGDHVIDITYNTAGNVTYGALFNSAGQVDHIDRRTQAKRARVASWLTYR